MFKASKRIAAFLSLLVAISAAGGCTPRCELDPNGDGQISEQELLAFQMPTDAAGMLGLYNTCGSLIMSLGTQSSAQ